MGQLVQLDQRANDLKNLFSVNAQRMTRAAPKGLDPQRLLTIAFNSIAYNTDLLVCTRESLIGGVFEALKLGLTLGGPMQEAWLIPFKVQGVPTATFIVGYQGYRNLIDRARTTMDLHPRAVHNGVGRPADVPDDFDYYYGDSPRIIHRPRGATPENEKQLRAVYCVARLRGGGVQMEVLEKEEVDAHRNRSRAKNSGPWVTDYVPMAMKTAVRKIAKYLPKASMEIARALELDEKADMGVDQTFDIEGIVVPPEPGVAAPQPQRALDGVKDQLRREQGKPEPAVASGPPPADEMNWGS